MHRTSVRQEGSPPERADLQQVYVIREDELLDELPRAVRRMIPLFDGQRSVAQVLCEAQISETRGLAVVRKLREAGVLTGAALSDPSTTRRSRDDLANAETLRDLPTIEGGFTEAEEAFFASEVQLPDEAVTSFGERVSLLLSTLLLRLWSAA